MAKGKGKNKLNKASRYARILQNKIAKMTKHLLKQPNDQQTAKRLNKGK